MTEGDRAAVAVDGLDVESEAPYAGEHLHGERLVDLHGVEVTDRPPGSPEPGGRSVTSTPWRSTRRSPCRCSPAYGASDSTSRPSTATAARSPSVIHSAAQVLA